MNINDRIGKWFYKHFEKDWIERAPKEYVAKVGTDAAKFFRKVISKAAITIGSYRFYAPNARTKARSTHEAVHVEQYAKYGASFIPLYVWYSIVALFKGDDLYKDNKFEEEAEVERLRAMIVPGDAAAHEERMAALEQRADAAERERDAIKECYVDLQRKSSEREYEVGIEHRRLERERDTYREECLIRGKELEHLRESYCRVKDARETPGSPVPYSRPEAAERERDKLRDDVAMLNTCVSALNERLARLREPLTEKEKTDLAFIWRHSAGGIVDVVREFLRLRGVKP